MVDLDSPLTPVVALGIVSYANNWYNTGSVTDLKPLLFAGVAGLFLEAFAALPGMKPAATLLGWTAFVGMLISPVQKPSPVENLLKVGTQNKKGNGKNG
jgi:hypothetical protein